MKIVISDYPTPPNEAHRYFQTVITHDGIGHDAEDLCWELEVYELCYGLLVHQPEYDRKMNRLDMLLFCMEHGSPGVAEGWIRNLMSDEDAEYVIKHYYSVGEDGRLRA